VRLYNFYNPPAGKNGKEKTDIHHYCGIMVTQKFILTPDYYRIASPGNIVIITLVWSITYFENFLSKV